MSQTTIDMRQFNDRLRRLSAAAPHAAAKIVRHQASLLVEDLAKAALPRDKRKAEINIEAVVHRAFTPSRTGRQAVDWPRYHRVRASYSTRTKTGRPMHIQPTVLRQFLKSRKEHIGTLAKGWLGSGNPLRARVTRIIERNKTYGTTAIRRLLFGIAITVTNKVKFGTTAKQGQYVHTVQSTIDKRARMMHAMLERWAKAGHATYKLPDWLTH